MTWDPDRYALFADERERPFADLVARLRHAGARLVADLGCGTGALTARLGGLFPDARVIGVDRSREMLARAAPLAVSGRLEFEEADLAAWEPPGVLDVVVSNAALHWVPDHAALLDRLAGMLAPDGSLAIQVPANNAAPTHVLLAALLAGRPQAALLPAAPEPMAWWVERLSSHGFAVDAWETTYGHLLRGEDPVLGWVTGTTLRPVLSALGEAEARELLREYGALLRAAYPERGGVTLLPFRRLFVVARRGGS